MLRTYDLRWHPTCHRTFGEDKTLLGLREPHAQQGPHGSPSELLQGRRGIKGEQLLPNLTQELHSSNTGVLDPAKLARGVELVRLHLCRSRSASGSGMQQQRDSTALPPSPRPPLPVTAARRRLAPPSSKVGLPHMPPGNPVLPRSIGIMCSQRPADEHTSVTACADAVGC